MLIQGFEYAFDKSVKLVLVAFGSCWTSLRRVKILFTHFMFDFDAWRFSCFSVQLIECRRLWEFFDLSMDIKSFSTFECCFDFRVSKEDSAFSTSFNRPFDNSGPSSWFLSWSPVLRILQKYLKIFAKIFSEKLPFKILYNIITIFSIS